ncbi:helix-turn-helix transcriptional regulator [Pseudomonas sp. SWRI179]|uniref:helix-turn-helix domain-containing protein n=1 Tax=Pseudomonas sp. SWRI179 TaxID=2745497 RepID=UPI001EE33DED|nr:helix-turn-helix transcriptional regulator [Pseudomonas sp. SWRI179]
MTTLFDVAEMLKQARAEAHLSQEALAIRAGVSRPTVARMETVAKGDMSVSALVRLLEAAGYDLKPVTAVHERTVEDILAEQRFGASESESRRSAHREIVQVPLAQSPIAEPLLARDSAIPANRHSGSPIMQSPTHNVTPANTRNVEYPS